MPLPGQQPGGGIGNGNLYSLINPFSFSENWDRTGTAPIMEIITIDIWEPDPIDYISFYINYENTSTPWICDNTNGNPIATSIPTDGLTADLQLYYIGLQTLPAGTYKATIFFKLENTTTGFSKTLSVPVTMVLSGNSATAIQVDKAKYNLLFSRETNTLTGETLANILNNTANEDLNFETVGTILKQKVVTNQILFEANPAIPMATNPDLPLNGVVNISARIKKSGVLQSTFNIALTVVESEMIITDKTNLQFELRRGLNETKSEFLKIINPFNKSFTITAPSWITLSANSGNTDMNLTVTTINSELIAKGTYSDNIIISYGSKTVVIPVKLNVLEFLKANFEDLNFCMDPQHEIEISKLNDSAVFTKITLEMHFETSNGIQNMISEYQIPYFQGVATSHIGKKIYHFFPMFSDIVSESTDTPFNNKFVCKPATVKLKIEELDANYAVLYAVERNDLKFFAGSKPKLFPLFTNHNLNRRYANTPYFFSYYNADVDKMKFLKNDVPGNSEIQNSVQAVKIADNFIHDGKLKQNFNLQVLPFPRGREYSFIQWINENKVPEGIVFAGTYKNEKSYQHVYDDFEENSKKYDVDKKNKITINTGFITKEERRIVNAIIDSKLCYLTIAGEVYKCYCVSDKITDLDADDFIIEYNLDFFIIK